MRNFKYIFLGLLASMMFVGCDDEDFTGDSSLEPSSPTVTLSGFESAYVFTEQDSTITITATLDVPQIVDIPIYISQSGGDATEGAEGDFVIDATNSRIVIPAYRTSASATITIMADDILEQTETFQITIGDDRTTNATLVPASFDVTLGNITDGDLVTTLSWAATAYDEAGELIDPTDLIDLALNFVASDGTITTEDLSDFEELTFNDDDFPDDTYTITATIFGSLSPGSFGLGAYPIDVNLDFYQYGVVDQALSFPGLLTSLVNCDQDTAVLATVVKSGGSYTITTIGEVDVRVDGVVETFLVGDYSVVDDQGHYSGDVTITASDRTTRTTEITWDGFGINLEDDIEFTFGCSGIVVAEQQIGGLGCSGDPVLTATTSSFGYYDESDDSEFVIIMTYTNAACYGGFDSELTFTKL